MLETEEKLAKLPEFSVKIKPDSKKVIYGMELIIELFGCDLSIITSKEKIQEFINGICREINMEKYGSSRIKRFPGGDLWGVGYSFLQFLTTSSITGHFIDNGGIAFLNVFSCKQYDDKKAAQFAEKFFRAKKINSKLIVH
jgi:S-adenosylmethionine/arginine decarboxylase-like enzyme